MIKLFCERGDFMENDWEFFVDAKQVTISSLILANYQKLGLTEEELVLFLQIDSQLQAGGEYSRYWENKPGDGQS